MFFQNNESINAKTFTPFLVIVPNFRVASEYKQK